MAAPNTRLVSINTLNALESQLEQVREDYPNAEPDIQDVLEEYARFLPKYRILKIRFDEQNKELESRKKLSAVGTVTGKPYILVLIDGNGYTFNNDLLLSYKGGGQRAATCLKNEVDQFAKKHFSEKNECQVIVRIYADLAGLSTQLAKQGKTPGMDLRSFAAEFTRYGGSMDFTDALDKTGSRDKVTAWLNTSIDDSACRHIILGVCHDIFYLPILQSCTLKAEKITLLRGSSFDKDLRQFDFKTTSFESVFSTEPPPKVLLVNEETDTWLELASASSRAAEGPKNAEYSRSVCRFWARGFCKNFRTCRFQHPNDQPYSPASKRNASKELPTPHEVLRHPYKIPVNSSGHRLDLGLRLPSMNQFAALKALSRDGRPCNDFHLRGFCPNGHYCSFSHRVLPDGPLAAMRYILKSKDCTNGGQCRIKDCYRGHVCQDDDCTGESKFGCKISPELHIKDRKVASWVSWIDELASEGSNPENDTTSGDLDSQKAVAGSDDAHQNGHHKPNPNGPSQNDTMAEWYDHKFWT